MPPDTAKYRQIPVWKFSQGHASVTGSMPNLRSIKANQTESNQFSPFLRLFAPLRGQFQFLRPPVLSLRCNPWRLRDESPEFSI
jgi:hypothetical protein